MRLLVRGVLEQADFLVKEATTGERAVALFSLLQPDLVLLNVLMPGMMALPPVRLFVLSPEASTCRSLW
jgi:CheY-like chemotaxis protein